MPQADAPFDVAVIGAGPAGAMAAIRAADLGARTLLVANGAFGGMAAHDGPVPVRALAHAARLMRDARQLPSYGIAVGMARLDYGALLDRVADVVAEVGGRAGLRPQAEAAGVVIEEHAGPTGFVGPNELVSATGRRWRATKFILCTGGVARRLGVSGGELCATHSDAWSLREAPASMLVIGAGATGAQVASVFSAFGTQVQLFQAGPRILPTEEPDVAAAVAAGFRSNGIAVHEDFGAILHFEHSADGVRMVFEKDGERGVAEADLAVCAIGWQADVAHLDLAVAGVTTTSRGFIQVDENQRTSAPHVWAAGDVTGQMMLAPQALQAGFRAASNAVTGAREGNRPAAEPVGSYTDPEYAQVGMGESAARANHRIEVVVVPFAESTRAVIDGRTAGFCKLIVDRANHRILGCHVVGDRAVDVVQLAAVAIAGELAVEALARLPFSFPTYAGILGRAAAAASHRLNRQDHLHVLSA